MAVMIRVGVIVRVRDRGKVWVNVGIWSWVSRVKVRLRRDEVRGAGRK